jgi:hypothetical protein
MSCTQTYTHTCALQRSTYQYLDGMEQLLGRLSANGYEVNAFMSRMGSFVYPCWVLCSPSMLVILMRMKLHSVKLRKSCKISAGSSETQLARVRV